MKNKEIELFIREKEKEIIVQKKENRDDWLVSKLKIVTGVGYLSIDKVKDENLEELFEKTIEYWKEVSNKKRLKCIGLFLKDSEQHLGKTLETHGFINIEKKFKHWMDKTGIYLNYVLDIQENASKHLFEISEEVFSFLEEKKKKDPTMESSRDSYKDFYLGEHLSIDQIDLYFQGIETETKIHFENGEWFLEIHEEKVKINTKEEVKSGLLTIFSNIEKKQRIRNLYNPPKKHLVDVLEEMLSGENRTNEIMEKIHEALLGYYTYQEIEENMKKLKEKEKWDLKIKLFFQKTEMIRLIDFVFVIDKDANVTTFPVEKKSEAISFYEKKVDEEIRHELRESKEILEKMFQTT